MKRHPIETWRVTEDTVRLWLEAGPPGDRISLEAGRTVYEQGEVSPYFYFVLSGKLKVSVLQPDGIELVMEFMGKVKRLSRSGVIEQEAGRIRVLDPVALDAR